MDTGSLALLEDNLARYTREKYTRAAWRSYGLEADGFAIGSWNALADLGCFNLGLPEQAGGSGACLADLLPLFLAAGAGLWREPLLPVLGAACGALIDLPHSARRDVLLTSIGTGAERHTFLDTGAASACSIVCERTCPDQYLATGTADFAIAAHSATGLMFHAPLEQDGGVGLFMVPRADPGIRLADYRCIDGRAAAAVELQAASAELIGVVNDVHAALRRCRVLAAAEAVGIMRAVTAAATRHLLSRKQFGRPLAHFQVLQHRIVDMTIREAESAALLHATTTAYDTATAHGAGAGAGAVARDLERRLLQLRIVAARAARMIAAEGIQLHGAMGMTEELGIGDYYKRALALDGGYLKPHAALDELAAAQEISA